mgnify:CR=1 FL=1
MGITPRTQRTVWAKMQEIITIMLVFVYLMALTILCLIITATLEFATYLAEKWRNLWKK